MTQFRDLLDQIDLNLTEKIDRFCKELESSETEEFDDIFSNIKDLFKSIKEEERQSFIDRLIFWLKEFSLNQKNSNLAENFQKLINQLSQTVTIVDKKADYQDSKEYRLSKTISSLETKINSLIIKSEPISEYLCATYLDCLIQFSNLTPKPDPFEMEARITKLIDLLVTSSVRKSTFLESILENLSDQLSVLVESFFSKENLSDLLIVLDDLCNKNPKEFSVKVSDFVSNLVTKQILSLDFIFENGNSDILLAYVGIKCSLLKTINDTKDIENKLNLKFLNILLSLNNSIELFKAMSQEDQFYLTDILFDSVPDILSANYLVNLEQNLAEIDLDETLKLLEIDPQDGDLSKLKDQLSNREFNIDHLKYGRFLIYLQNLGDEDVLEFINKAKSNKELKDIVEVIKALHPGVLNQYKREEVQSIKKELSSVLEEQSEVAKFKDQKGLLNSIKRAYKHFIEVSTPNAQTFGETRLLDDFIMYINNNISEIVIAFSDPEFKIEFENIIADAYTKLKGDNKSKFSKLLQTLILDKRISILLSDNIVDLWLKDLLNLNPREYAKILESISADSNVKESMYNRSVFFKNVSDKVLSILSKETPTRDEVSLVEKIIRHFSKQNTLAMQYVAKFVFEIMRDIFSKPHKKELLKRLDIGVDYLDISKSEHIKIFYVVYKEVISRKLQDSRSLVNGVSSREKEEFLLKILESASKYYKENRSEYNKIRDELNYRPVDNELIDTNSNISILKFTDNIDSLVNRGKVLFSSVLDSFNQLESVVLKLDFDLDKFNEKSDLVESLYIFLFLTRNYPDLQKRIYKLIENVMAILTETDTFKEAISSADSKINNLRNLDSAGNKRAVPLQDSKESVEYLRKARLLILKKQNIITSKNLNLDRVVSLEENQSTNILEQTAA